MTLVKQARALARDLKRLTFSAPVTHVYNPLDYAFAPHRAYLERYGQGRRDVLLVGMNPGPWGMAQTGVPFGVVNAVRDWLGITGPVHAPADGHPKRPVDGFACPRREVSGQRLWGWAEARFGRPEAFFDRFFVANYCPLMFLEASGRNRTPDKLPVAERALLLARCDRSLQDLVDHFQPTWVLGVGQFAEGRCRAALSEGGVRVGRVLHPSPASPVANRGWAEQAEAQLRGYGIDVPQ